MPIARLRRGGVIAAPLLTTLLAGGIAACTSHTESRPVRVNAQTFELQRIVDEVHRQTGVPALAAAWVRSDGMIHAVVAGARAIGESRTPMGLEDRVQLGAVTDQFVAGTLLTMLNEKRIRWDSTIQEMLRDLVAGIRPEYREITLEQLLTRRTSIAPVSSANLKEFVALGGMPGTAVARREALVHWALARPAASAAIPDATYPDLNYLVAAHMAERATGTPFDTDLLERLIKRMEQPQDCGAALADMPGRVTVTGHVGTPAAPLVAPPDNPDVMPAAMAPIADVRCSISSLAQFARQQVRALRGVGISIVFPSTEVQRLYSASAPQATGRRIVRQRAGAASFAALVTLLPDDDLAVVVAANAGFGDLACARVTADILASLGVSAP